MLVRLPPTPAPPKPNLLQRLQRTWELWFGGPSEVQGAGTTQTAHQIESPANFEYQVIQLEYDRRAIMNDVRRLMDDDPRLAQSNQDIGRDCVGPGLTVKINAAEGTADAVVKQAQDVVDSLLRDTDLSGQLGGMFAALLEDGDLFLSPVVRGDRISRIQTLPAATIERLDNELGLFADVNQAFRQVDVLTLEQTNLFPLWQVNHIRYDWRPNRGAKYGRSMYMQVRGLGRYLGMTENDLVVRRRTRAPLRFFHQVGTPDMPGDEPDITKYKQRNSLDKPQSQRVTTDYFGNGKTSVTALQGDAKLDEIDDIKHLENVYMVRMGRPKGLMGYGEDINRDVLDPQRSEYQKFLRGLRTLLWNGDGGIYSGVKALCDFALMLAGISPQLITYQPSWPMELTKEQLEFIKEVDDRRLSGLISHQTALGLVGPLLGIESAEAELLLIDQERERRQASEDESDRAFAARQTGAGKGMRSMSKTGMTEDDDLPTKGVVQ